MSEKLLGKVQRLKYKRVFLEMTTYTNSEGVFKRLEFSGHLVGQDKSGFRAACGVVNALLDRGVLHRQSIIGSLKRERGISPAVLAFMVNLVTSTHLPIG